MKKTNLFLVLLAFALTSCATRGPDSSILYDLGPMLTHQANSSRLLSTTPFLLTNTQASYWLDNTLIHYRLAYANNQQTRSYANSRWNMPPAKLFEQRLKAHIVAAGGVALPANDGERNGIMLRLELDDFSQRFDAPENSIAQVELRVSAFRGRALLGQKTFRQSAPAPSADAAGGARGLALASDELITDAVMWLAGLQQRTHD